MPEITDAAVDAGAEALRIKMNDHRENGHLIPWAHLRSSKKKKWREATLAVLEAAIEKNA